MLPSFEIAPPAGGDNGKPTAAAMSATISWAMRGTPLTPHGMAIFMVGCFYKALSTQDCGYCSLAIEIFSEKST